MQKGIRQFCNVVFCDMLPTRVNTREGNMAFRKAVRNAVIAQFGCSEAAASTHYNYSFQAVKKGRPDAVVGLGRPAADVVDAPVQVAPLQLAAPVLALPAPALCKVVKAKDGSLVAENLTLADAEALVARAAAQKKAKLQIV